MPHASLLGSNGHHSTFTSEMISGQINVFIVLQKKKLKKIHPHTQYRHRDDSYTCMPTSVCTHSSEIKMQYKNTHRLFAHTALSFARVLMCRATHVTQLKDQHHLEVRIRHCPCLAEVLKLTSVSLLWESIEKCFLIVSLKPFIEKKGICCHKCVQHMDYK